MSFAPMVQFDQSMEEAWPAIDCLHEATGSSVIVQLRSPRSKTKGGIYLPPEVQDTVQWNTVTAKVVHVGPVAFRNRTTMEPWPEGAWFKAGDFLRAPKYGGDRWEVKFENDREEGVVLFALFNDLDLKARVKGDPRDVVAFV
jgi:co-chaperonin GroES (HSP10)